MRPSWSFFEGESIAGRYPLLRLLTGDESTAFFRTEAGEARTPAVIQLLRAEFPEAGATLTRWHTSGQISHPGLATVFETGEAALDMDPVVFRVSELGEENLGTVLAGRQLTEAETKEVLQAALDALHFLHDRGFVHGALGPSSIFSVGTQIKLAGESIVPAGQALSYADEGSAPEVLEGAGAVPASDMWSLGLATIEMLHGRSSLPAVPGAMPPLPAPFDRLVSGCLQANPNRRLTARQAALLLEGKAEPGKDALRARSAAAASADKNSSPSQRRADWAKPGVLAASILLLLVLGLTFSRNRERKEPVEPSPAPISTFGPAQPTPAPSNGSTSANTLRAPASNSAPEQRQPNARQERPKNRYVIVATYSRLADAQRRARQISAKWPAFPASVHSPNQDRSPHLVAIAARVTQADAEEMLRDARRAGLPRDAYVTQQ